MIKYFQKAFQITNDNIILTTPMVLFLFLLSIYIGIAQGAPINLASSILISLTTLFMLSAFFAGWFYMVQKAIELDKKEFILDQDKAKASFGLMKEIYVGVGEYFFSFIGALILYVFFILALLLVGFKIGFHYIGDVGVSISSLREAFVSSAAMKSLVTSLNSEQLIKLNSWNILFLAVTSIFSFFTMFWPAQIVAGVKNPLVALFKSIGSIFKKPLSAIVLFLYVSFINFVISFVSAVSAVNTILYFISMLLYFYFLVYVVVLIFLYYDREMQAKENKGDSDSGADSFGQDEDVDKPGEGE